MSLSGLSRAIAITTYDLPILCVELPIHVYGALSDSGETPGDHGREGINRWRRPEIGRNCRPENGKFENIDTNSGPREKYVDH